MFAEQILSRTRTTDDNTVLCELRNTHRLATDFGERTVLLLPGLRQRRPLHMRLLLPTIWWGMSRSRASIRCYLARARAGRRRETGSWGVPGQSWHGLLRTYQQIRPWSGHSL